MASSKQSLLASLTDVSGGTPSTDDAVAQDLFGDLQDESPPLIAADAPIAPAPNGTSSSSQLTSKLLEGSGLLEDSSLPPVSNGSLAGGGGGLFDEVDQEQARLEQEERRRQVQHERLAQEQQRQQEEERIRQEQQAEQARLQQQEQLQQQQAQMASQMHSVTISSPAQGYANVASPTYTPQQQQQVPPHNFSPQGFYRPHEPLSSGGGPAPPPPSSIQSNAYHGSMLTYSTTGGPTQTHTFRPSITAGMHNATNMARPPNVRESLKPPAHVKPLYTNIAVSDPILVQSSGGLLTAVGMHSPPHWSYQVTCSVAPEEGGGSWLVRRRFRHVVALEERLRQDCPGAILPPRPEKHATRAIEEASTTQTAEFAKQRTDELQVYINALCLHPIAGHSSVLKLFLALQDDMGTAWPEVSSNAFTRLSAVGAGAAVMVAETSASLTEGATGTASALKVGEDNAELLALASSEGLRMGAVTHAVPKLEGAVALIREQGEMKGACGMELNKLTKELEASDKDLTVPLQILSSGLLRCSRRTKRLAMELSAAMGTFVNQYKVCKNEHRAFQDRRHALQRCQKERSKADVRAQRLLLQQRTAMTGAHGQLARAERDAVVSDDVAVSTVQECEQIGERLKSEVNRVAYERRAEWSRSMKVVASAMKEACSERVAIWESTRESFLQAFPEEAAAEGHASAGGGSVAPLS